MPGPQTRIPSADRVATHGPTRRHRRPIQMGVSRSYTHSEVCPAHPSSRRDVVRTAGARDVLRHLRNRKREHGTRTVIRRGPEMAVMTLDNGATHRQADSHPAGLGCVERLKEFVEALRVETYAGVFDA